MEENKNVCQNCEVIKPGHVIKVKNMDTMECSVCGKIFKPTETITYGADRHQMSATLWVMLEKINHEATRAREYLRLTGATCTPDRVHEVLHLRTSRATLARKMREAAQRGELLRSYYVNERGTKICQ